MRKSFLNKLIIGVVLISVVSCKTKKAAVQAGSAPVASSVSKPLIAKDEVINSITDKQASFNTLVIKAKADLNINNNSNDVSMNIRIKNGEALWISVTALAGLEVARALITPDSIKVLNRIQNEYIKKPFSYIHQFANAQVDFKTVQSLFTGNAIPGTVSLNSEVDVKDGATQVSGNLAGIVYKLLFNPNYNLIQNNLSDPGNGQNLVVNYSEFQNVQGQEIPFLVNINSVAQSKTVSLNLKYNSVTVNEGVEFPFNVPKRFTVKN